MGALEIQQLLLDREPPPKPVSDPSAPMTRWQGITMGMGLLPFASPTAREAFTSPRSVASAPYVVVSP